MGAVPSIDEGVQTVTGSTVWRLNLGGLQANPVDIVPATAADVALLSGSANSGDVIRHVAVQENDWSLVGVTHTHDTSCEQYFLVSTTKERPDVSVLLGALLRSAMGPCPEGTIFMQRSPAGGEAPGVPRSPEDLLVHLQRSLSLSEDVLVVLLREWLHWHDRQRLATARSRDPRLQAVCTSMERAADAVDPQAIVSGETLFVPDL